MKNLFSSDRVESVCSLFRKTIAAANLMSGTRTAGYEWGRGVRTLFDSGLIVPDTNIVSIGHSAGACIMSDPCHHVNISIIFSHRSSTQGIIYD
jgi:hypothetical protein